MKTNAQQFPLPPVAFAFAGFTWPRYVATLPRGSLKKRIADRKSRFCGPYYHAPKPVERGQDNGRGFYLESDGMPELRWNWCDEVSGARIRGTGWFSDSDQSDKIRGVVFRLPGARGFLAGWSMGEGMSSDLEYYIYDSETDAARAADSLAESAAERQRDYEEREQERLDREEEQENNRQEIADARELIRESRAFVRHLIQQYKRDRKVVGSTIIRAAVVKTVSGCLTSIRKARDTIERLEG